jgi:hypothetical protein
MSSAAPLLSSWVSVPALHYGALTVGRHQAATNKLEQKKREINPNGNKIV